MRNKFKAGDFTSGKMGAIFKKCYFEDIAIISHKQFGLSYMIPEDFFRRIAKQLLSKNKKFKSFAEMNFGSIDDFFFCDDLACFEEIAEFYGTDDVIDNWFDVLGFIVK